MSGECSWEWIDDSITDFQPGSQDSSLLASTDMFPLEEPSEDSSDSFDEFRNGYYSPSRPSSPAPEQALSCPRCKEHTFDLRSPLSLCHDHMQSCFAKSKKPKLSTRKTRTCIARIRRNIKKLGLSEQINLMESFSQLAHSAAASAKSKKAKTQQDGDSDQAPAMLSANTLHALSLLIGNPAPGADSPSMRTRGHTSLPPLKLDLTCDVNLAREMSTPSHPPCHSPTFLDMGKHGLYTPEPTPLRPLSSRKRKLDVAQALSFSPFPLETNANTMAFAPAAPLVL